MTLNPRMADRIAVVYAKRSTLEGQKAANAGAIKHLKNSQEDIAVLAEAVKRLTEKKNSSG